MIKFAAGTSENKAISVLETPTGKSVLLVFNEWKSVKVYRLALFHDVTATVCDKTGKQLAAKPLKGTNIIEEADIFRTITVHYCAERVPLHFKRKIEELFNSPQIVNALKSIRERCFSYLGRGIVQKSVINEKSFFK